MIVSPRSNSEPAGRRIALPDDPDLAERLRKEHPALYTNAPRSHAKILAAAGLASIIAGYAAGSLFTPHRQSIATPGRANHAAPMAVYHRPAHIVIPAHKPAYRKPAIVTPQRSTVRFTAPVLQPQEIAVQRSRASAVAQANAQAQAQAEARFWLQAQAQARARDRAREKTSVVAAVSLPRTGATNATVAAPPNTGSTASDPTGNTAPRAPTGGCRHGRGISIGGHGIAAGILNFVLQNVRVKGLLPGRP